MRDEPIIEPLAGCDPHQHRKAEKGEPMQLRHERLRPSLTSKPSASQFGCLKVREDDADYTIPRDTTRT